MESRLFIAFQDHQDVILPHDQVILPFELKFLAGVFAIEDNIAYLYGHQVAIFSRADCYDFAALGFFFSSVRDDDPTFSFLFCQSWLNYYSVIDGLHSYELLWFCFVK